MQTINNTKQPRNYIGTFHRVGPSIHLYHENGRVEYLLALNDREIELLRLLFVEGFEYDEAAKRLNLTTGTAKKVGTEINKKLGEPTLFRSVRKALMLGLITMEMFEEVTYVQMFESMY